MLSDGNLHVSLANLSSQSCITSYALSFFRVSRPSNSLARPWACVSSTCTQNSLSEEVLERCESSNGLGLLTTEVYVQLVVGVPLVEL